jgi:hypothetical protein
MSFAFVRGLEQRGAQAAETPDWLWELLEATFGPVWDPCPHNPTFDGLTVSWNECARKESKRQAYVNPEFKQIGRWVSKAIAELNASKFPSIFLIPFRPQTKYFREQILPHATEIRILSKLIAFKGFDKPFPQRLCIVVFGKPVRHIKQNLLSTRPLFVDLAMCQVELPHMIQRYTADRASALSTLDNVPDQGLLHALPHGNMSKWLVVLQERGSIDFYSLLNDRTQTFVRLLQEPALSAIIFMPSLLMEGGARTNAYGSWVLLSEPPSTALQAEWIELPPTTIWQI